MKRKNLIKARTDANMTQDQLANKIEVNRVSVGRWEIGVRAPGAADLYAIQKVTKTKFNIDELLEVSE